MKIEILYFEEIHDESSKKAYIDFKVEYDFEKWEIFRNYILYEKNNKKWISPGIVKRDNKWIKKYERKPGMGKIFEELLKQINNQMIEMPKIAEKGSILSPNRLF